jgi:HSP20 family protein
VLIDDVKIPLEFRQIQAAHLIGWDGTTAHRELDRLLTAVTSILAQDEKDSEPTNDYSWAPPMDILVLDGRYIVKIELPGIAPDDLDIEVQSSLLVVSGIRRVNTIIGEGKYLLSERRDSRFFRSIRFPDDLSGKYLTRDYRDGVLTLVFSESN